MGYVRMGPNRYNHFNTITYIVHVHTYIHTYICTCMCKYEHTYVLVQISQAGICVYTLYVQSMYMYMYQGPTVSVISTPHTECAHSLMHALIMHCQFTTLLEQAKHLAHKACEVILTTKLNHLLTSYPEPNTQQIAGKCNIFQSKQLVSGQCTSRTRTYAHAWLTHM